MKQRNKFAWLVFYGGWVALIGVSSLWLLVNAITWVGKGLAVAGLLLLPLPILVSRWHRHKKMQKIWGQAAALPGLLIVSFFVAILLAAPSGSPGPDSPVQHRFFRENQFNRYAITNIIPESEQINLGFLLMPYLDPILTRAQADRVSIFTMDLYREMERNPDFRELGSVMGLAYAELLRRPVVGGHYYLYVPQRESESPWPTIVFLHGSAGNFKAYTWVWSKLAEAGGFVIIAPSYGFGNWDAEGTEMVLQAIDDARQVVDIDTDHIYLAGLSNGGLGVSQLAAERPGMFRGLIFLSPVMRTDIVDSQTFQAQWAGRPVLVISGEADRRIPPQYVERRVVRMAAGGIDMTYISYPQEDHFLVFSQPDRIMQDISDWIEVNW